MTKRKPVPTPVLDMPHEAYVQISRRKIVGELDCDKYVLELQLDDGHQEPDGNRIYMRAFGSDEYVAIPLEAVPQVIEALQAFYDETEG